MRFHKNFPQRFRTDDRCLQYLFDVRCADVKCPKCGRVDSYHKHPAKKCYTCNCGRFHIYPMKGTIFGGTVLPLTKQFYAIYLMSGKKNGMSAKELERKLGIAYDTARKIAKKIRAVKLHTEERNHIKRFRQLLLLAIGGPVRLKK